MMIVTGENLKSILPRQESNPHRVGILRYYEITSYPTKVDLFWLCVFHWKFPSLTIMRGSKYHEWIINDTKIPDQNNMVGYLLSSSNAEFLLTLLEKSFSRKEHYWFLLYFLRNTCFDILCWLRFLSKTTYYYLSKSKMKLYSQFWSFHFSLLFVTLLCWKAFG